MEDGSTTADGGIVCGVDGSVHANRAIDFAARLSAAAGLTLALVAVNQTRPASGFPDISAWSAAEADALLEAAGRRAREQGAETRLVLTAGRNVAEALIDAAERLGARHLVVGAGDDALIRRLLLGSVAREIVTRAPFTTTVVR